MSARVTDGHTKSELSQYLGCSRKTIQRWIDEGLLKGRYEGRNRPDDTLRITDEDFRAFWKKHPWEVPLFRLNHEGLLWFCSVMFDIPPNDYFGDPLDRRQRRLNFQMSVKNLYQSFEDRERVPKIQGLLNECMTFLDDELSLVTGPYEDLLSIDEVIQNELILFVSLNINKNTEPVRALGKMLLQNLQLVIGKRYENQHSPELSKRPLVSVVLDEFAPFGYRNFPQIVQMARGTNTAFLFSMQSLPQLMSVGRGFKEDVSSAPNTTLCMRTRDEISAQYFIKASSQQRAVRRTLGVQRRKLLSWEQYSETGSGTFTELKETRALDEHIKNLPKGQMEVLMSDDTRGTLHGLLHVAPPPAVNFPGYEPCLPKRLDSSREGNKGACLRLKDAKLARSLKVPRTARGA